MRASFIRTDTRPGVRVIHVENPPVNALSPGVPEALMDAIDDANADPDVKAVVVMGAGSAPRQSLIDGEQNTSHLPGTVVLGQAPTCRTRLSSSSRAQILTSSFHSRVSTRRAAPKQSVKPSDWLTRV
jgi:hypothetical protein